EPRSDCSESGQSWKAGATRFKNGGPGNLDEDACGWRNRDRNVQSWKRAGASEREMGGDWVKGDTEKGARPLDTQRCEVGWDGVHGYCAAAWSGDVESHIVTIDKKKQIPHPAKNVHSLPRGTSGIRDGNALRA